MFPALVATALTVFALFVTLRHLGVGRSENAPHLVHGVLPFVGCFAEFFEDPYGFLLKQQKKYGNVFTVKMGGVKNTFVLDNRFIPQFFRATEDKLDADAALLSRGIVVPLIGEQLPTPAEVKFIRRLKAVVFRQKFAHLFNNLTGGFEEILAEVIQQSGEHSGVMQSSEVLPLAILRMTVRAMVGHEMVHNTEFLDLIFSQPGLLAEAETKMMSAWPAVFRRSQTFHHEFRELLAPIVEQRRRWQREDPENWMKTHGLDDLLSCMLDEWPGGCPEHNLSEEQVGRLLFNIVCAGIYGALANTPAAIEGTLVSILDNPEVYRGICDEIELACRLHDTTDLNKIPNGELELLNASFKEYTRLYPGLMLSRKVMGKPLTLPDGSIVPPNSLVSIVPRFIMRDPARFPEPDKFNPYRIFTDEFKQAEKDSLYVTFGGGKHKCQGVTMARNELKIAVGSLIQNFELELLDPFPGTSMTTTNMETLSKSVRIRYERRNAKLGEMIRMHRG